MKLNSKTLEKLRDLINEDTVYRSGPKLVEFFNQLGFHDSYGQGFPSRWIYTDERLSKINETPELDKCIRMIFAPINFIGRFTILDQLIIDFNQYLAFDGWKVVRKGQEITFTRSGGVDIDEQIANEKAETVETFLSCNYELSVDMLNLNAQLITVITGRIEEIKKCMAAKAALSVIFLAGSTLEGILLNLAITNPKLFNSARSTPKDKDGKVKRFPDWTLNNFIDVSYELGFLKEDIMKFSHGLRDFRNYIHPFEQMSRQFNPNEQTAEICFQVLKAAVYQISKTDHSN